MLIPILRAFLGMFFLLGLAALLSRKRNAINLRVVISALVLQWTIGVLVLFVPAGRHGLHGLADILDWVLVRGQDGASFLFGGLVAPKMFDLFGSGGFVFALRVLPELIYICALSAVLYHYGVMQVLARLIGAVVRRIVGASAFESFSAVLTIFLGQSEMPVVVRPYLLAVGTSELFTIMCAGPASISGAMLAGYSALGVKMEYILAASFMAIPGGILFAKILYPTDPLETPVSLDMTTRKHSSVFEAIAEGVATGTQVVVAVAGMLIAFVSLIALIDAAIGAIGHQFGVPGLSLHGALGTVFAPLAWVMGAPSQDCQAIGGLLGQKIAFNELVAYVAMQPMLVAHTLSPRGVAIASFALCGFANLATIGILMGVYGGVLPERRAEIARLAPRAVLAGMLSNALSATIAGALVS